MIIDSLKNASLYYGLNERIAFGLEFLEKDNLIGMAPGRYEIDGSNIFALIQHYETKPQERGKWEAHRRYIDIQFVVQGMERMGYANLGTMEISEPYNEKDDYLLLGGSGDFFTVRAGTFVVFAPEDVHMPTIAVSSPQPVIKVVVKVRV
ncbi:MAG: YhcH/YjgK/YiaL family protein [Phycisphaerae bacterium]